MNVDLRRTRLHVYQPLLVIGICLVPHPGVCCRGGGFSFTQPGIYRVRHEIPTPGKPGPSGAPTTRRDCRPGNPSIPAFEMSGVSSGVGACPANMQSMRDRTATFTSRGRIVIPAELRRKFGIKAGTRVKFMGR